MRARVWRVYLLVAALATGGYFLLSSLALQDMLYDALGLMAVIAIVVGVRLHRPSRPAPWYLFAAGLFLFVAGDFTFSLYEVFLHMKTPFPSVADVFYLAGYPVITAGLFVLIRGRTPGRDRAGLIDSVIIAVGLAVLSCVYLMVPYARDASLSLLERAVSIAYPLG